MELTVIRSEDFDLTGDGSAAAWQQTEWQAMCHVTEGPEPYETKCKVLYSDKGLYVLVHCEDRHLTCTITEDMANIFQEDVVEIFVDPGHAQSGEQRVYFEYELSPLNVELAVMVPNHAGIFHGWLPWNYEGDRKVRHATSIMGGERRRMATCDGWQAECFIPFALLKGLANAEPSRGTRWRANIYRIDHDNGAIHHWAWSPETGSGFHDFRNFGTLVFE